MGKHSVEGTGGTTLYHDYCVFVRGSSLWEAAVSLINVRDFKRCYNLHDGVGVVYVHYCLVVHTDPQCTAMLVQRTDYWWV